jgi:energy-converting hydrogenase Eha subunit B
MAYRGKAVQLLIPVWVGNGYRICGSVGFRGCIGYMKTLVTLHLLNLYGWENGLGFSIFESFCGCVGSSVGERVLALL